MTVLQTGSPAPRADRPATQLVHDEPNARVVSFHVAPGQSVPPHASESTVVVQVIEGEGLVRGAEGEARLGPGQAAVYAPGEVHSMNPRAGAACAFSRF